MNKSVSVFHFIRHVARMWLCAHVFMRACVYARMCLCANVLGSFYRHSTFLRTKEIAGVTLYERSLLTLFSVLY